MKMRRPRLYTEFWKTLVLLWGWAQSTCEAQVGLFVKSRKEEITLEYRGMKNLLRREVQRLRSRKRNETLSSLKFCSGFERKPETKYLPLHSYSVHATSTTSNFKKCFDRRAWRLRQCLSRFHPESSVLGSRIFVMAMTGFISRKLLKKVVLVKRSSST